MPQALPHPDKISQSSGRKRAYRTKMAEFGNGYSQTAPDGINPVRDTWDLQYENLTNDEQLAAAAVFDAVQGWDYMTWTAYGDTVEKRWKITPDGWSASTTGTHWNISLTIVQVY